MGNQTLDYISRMPHFSFLPEKEHRKIADAAVEQHLPAGTLYAVQGETHIKDVFIVVKGALVLYDDRKDRGKPTGYIKPAEVFGGITLLLNAGISLRTVRVEEDTTGYAVASDVFLDLCARYKSFYEYFLENFSHNIFDESLASIIETGQAKHFLSGIAPFSFLPEEDIEQAASHLTMVQYPKDTILFVQERSRIGYLYILEKGSVERYYEENHRKTMVEMLQEGDLYGGISMLLNDGISVRTLRVVEKSYFYLLPKREFMELCSRHEAFTEYFTDIFGKRMLQKSYAAIIAKTQQAQEEGLQFLNRPVSSLYPHAPIFGGVDMSIRDAARKMADEKISSIFLQDAEEKCVGVVTERDLARKVSAVGYDVDRPVSEIMSTPVHSISQQALIFEALMSMMREDFRHLAVTDTDGRVVGILSNRDLLAAQGQSPLFLIREITDAGDMEGIIEKHKQLPRMLRSLIAGGATAQNLTRFITTVSDAIQKKIMAFTLAQCGPPPVPFSFMILGSDGRREQTLKTDQDNAIVFEDVPDSSLAEVSEYFLKYGDVACGLLDQAGYAFCTGGVMAKNPKWCQPLSKWKEYFSSWIHTAEAEDLLQASIFFDFRHGYGEARLVSDLRDYLFDSLEGWSGFFRHLTENALHFKPPIGFLGNFVVESKGQHRSKFDIKSAMTPIVDFARLYALKHRVAETNTLERLNYLRLKQALTAQEYEELQKAYGFLMQLRFVRQVTAAIDEKSEPDNYINPKKLTGIEQKMLKEIFKRVEKFQSKMEFEFTGLV
jgi:CBS domain-containing protein